MEERVEKLEKEVTELRQSVIRLIELMEKTLLQVSIRKEKK